MKGKIALITGASRGIGKAIAIAIAKKGADIVINDIPAMEEEANKTVEEIKALGVDAIFVAADVSNFESCKKMIETIKEKKSKIDILVNNAGITKDRTLKKMVPEEWNAVINVNLNSLYNVTHNALALEAIPEGGRIIGISSIVGMGGNFGQTNYSATKAGVIGFTKSLSKELGSKKITVNAIAPGFIKTPMSDKIPIIMLEQILGLIPLKEMGMPEDIAKLAAFLASDDAAYITGQVIRVDGGLGM